MDFKKTKIRNLIEIKRKMNLDERGYFGRAYCEKEFLEQGIVERFVQVNLCYNEKKNTLRGLHYQKERQEDKLVCCIRGRIWDVCVDLRKDSDTYLEYYATELSEENGVMLYIPKGCAHGYITLEDDSYILYMMSEFYVPGNEAGIRYDDPQIGIEWPDMGDNLTISEKDRMLPYIS